MNIICYLSLNIVYCQCHSCHIYIPNIGYYYCHVYPHICMFIWLSGMSRSSPSFRTCHLMQTHLVPITSTFVLPTSVSIPYLSLSLCGQAWQEGVHHGNHIIRCIPSCYPSLIFSLLIFMISCIIMFAGGHTMSNAPDLF